MKRLVLILPLLIQTLTVYPQKESSLQIFENTKKWNREVIQFPIEWAPKFKLTGFEELLFTPNWNKPKDQDYWSLLIGWKINTEQLISLAEIESNFQGYFDGLMKPNHWSKEFPDPKVSFRKDKNDFLGTMTFFDGFHTGKVIKVNIRGNQKFDKTKKKSIIRFRISPQEFDHYIWNKLNEIKVTETSRSIFYLDSSWGKERFPFPINFAPEINYNGIAEVRFPPKGWRDPNHENFWSYTYAWKINLDKPITAVELATNLELYFDGLNNLKNNKDLSKHKAVANVIKIRSLHNNDLFIGRIKTYDRFATNNELELNVLIEVFNYPTEKQSILHFKFSPKRFSHKTWEMLSKIQLNKNK
ncbi:hypothetical protein [Tenacibaculum sp. 190524A05c]|uniref:hypothetical protein n=1 Tax=Tenacibaculum platacis TaxID=3137852 RepID=UPI0031FB588E